MGSRLFSGNICDSGGDSAKRQLGFDGTLLECRLGHAVDCGSSFILTNGMRTLLAHVEQSLCAIFSHAGQQNSTGISADFVCHGVE